MGKARDAVALTLEMLEVFRQNGEVRTSVYGAFLVSLGKVERLAAHPDESMDANDTDGRDDIWWRDATGRYWHLVGLGGAVDYSDRDGNLWHWAGGFHAAPDKQPIMSRDDWSVTDVPLCYALAAVGPFRAMS